MGINTPIFLICICRHVPATARRLLCEVHEEYATNIALALHGYWVYDFSLPLLILHAFTFKTMDNLRHWLTICPRRQITVLDTHDGMGIDDIAGLAEVRASSPSSVDIAYYYFSGVV